MEEKTRELREFFSMLTHDLRIPLAAIRGYADLLGRAPLSERQARFLRGIQSANSSLLELVRNLLDAVRFDAGPVEMVPEAFDLEALVGEVVSNAGPSAEASRICVKTPGRRARGGGSTRTAGPDQPAAQRLTTGSGGILVLRAVERTEVEIEAPTVTGIAEENCRTSRVPPHAPGPSPGLGLGRIVRCILGYGRPSRSAPGSDAHASVDFPLPAPPGWEGLRLSPKAPN